MTDMDTLIVAWIIEQTAPHEDKIFEGSRKLVWHPYAAWYDTETWGDGRAMWVRTPLGPATALQQALAERDEAREGHAAARQNFHMMQGSAAELAAQVQQSHCCP